MQEIEGAGNRFKNSGQAAQSAPGSTPTPQPAPDSIPGTAAFGPRGSSGEQLRDKLVQTGRDLARIQPAPSSTTAASAEQQEKQSFWRTIASALFGWMTGPKAKTSSSSEAPKMKRSPEEIKELLAKLGTSDKSLQSFLLPLKEAQMKLSDLFDDVNHLLRSRVLELHRSIGAIMDNVKGDPDDVNDAPELTVYVTHTVNNIEDWIKVRIHVQDRAGQRKQEEQLMELLNLAVMYLKQTLDAMRSGDRKQLSTQMKVLRDVMAEQLNAGTL